MNSEIHPFHRLLDGRIARALRVANGIDIKQMQAHKRHFGDYQHFSQSYLSRVEDGKAPFCVDYFLAAKVTKIGDGPNEGIRRVDALIEPVYAVALAAAIGAGVQHLGTVGEDGCRGLYDFSVLVVLNRELAAKLAKQEG